MLPSYRLRTKLAAIDRSALSLYCIVAAFGTYFCMYAFRKPFTAGTFDVSYWGVGFKTILISSQVAGYTLSKFIGIKVISEMPAHRRAVSILVMIGLAHAALLGFAVVPRPWNLAMLFLNGLPLGMVFGLVLAFLEGRQTTEALSAGLCASFIVSSGVVKSVGHWLIQSYGVSEYWMPFWTGVVFLPGLLLAVWLLSQIPPPTEQDIRCRAERRPMTRADRKEFLRRHGFGLGLLIAVFILLTIIRSIRDDFAVEIWTELDASYDSAVFAKTEILTAFVVVFINGMAITIKDNRRALLVCLSLCAVGFVTVLAALFGHWAKVLAPFPFMVLTGLGFYVPYVAYHTTIFERLIASVKEVANIGYLMYLADALGYLGYVAVLVFENLRSTQFSMLRLFTSVTLGISIVSMGLIGWLFVYYARRLSRVDGHV